MLPRHPDEIDEAVALIPPPQERASQPPSRRLLVCRLFPLLCICTLERCTFYEYVADALNSQPSHKELPYCGIIGGSVGLNLADSWKGQALLGVAYLLPVLGGFASDWHCGVSSVLQTGCAFYCLGAWMMTGLVYVPFVCLDVVKYLCQGVLALGAGLVRPSLIAMCYEVGQPLLGTAGLCYLYYVCEALGQVIGCLLAYFTDHIQKPLTIACMPTTHLMLGLAICTVRQERQGWNPGQFQLPSCWPRIRRILIVIMPIILLSSVLMLVSFTIGGWEYAHLAGLTTMKEQIKSTDTLLLVWSASLLVVVSALSLLTWRFRSLKSFIFRISLGIAVVAANQFVSFGLILGLRAKENRREALLIVFGGQSVLYAVSEALTFVAANEIAFKIAAVEIRAFMVGLFMSLKGSGFFTTIMILLIYINVTGETEFHGKKVCYVHLGLGIALTLALLSFIRWAPRALQWLIDIEAAASCNRREDELPH